MSLVMGFYDDCLCEPFGLVNSSGNFLSLFPYNVITPTFHSLMSSHLFLPMNLILTCRFYN
jgi:hypothetical protein